MKGKIHYEKDENGNQVYDSDDGKEVKLFEPYANT